MADLIIVMVFLLVLIGGLVGVAMGLEYKTCNVQASKMGYENSWGALQGCMINTPSGWMPIENLREFK